VIPSVSTPAVTSEIEEPTTPDVSPDVSADEDVADPSDEDVIEAEHAQSDFYFEVDDLDVVSAA
jgi:hypothetical protein